MARLLQIGYTIDEALLEFSSQRQFGDSNWIAPVVERLQEGASVTEALTLLSLPQLARSFLTVGESSGDISGCFLQIANYMEQTLNVQTKLLRSMSYPLFLCALNLMIVVFLQYEVAPQLINMYVGLHVPPSTFTQTVLVDLRIVVQVLPFAIGLLVVFSVQGLYFYLFRPKLFERITAWMLLYPSTLTRLYLNWFWLSQLCVLLKGGHDVVAALQTISKSSPRSPLSPASDNVIHRLMSGSSFADSFQDVNWLDKRVASFNRMGDKTGDYAAVLTDAAELLKQDLDDRLTRLPKQVEPVLLVLSAVFLGMVYLAMVLPIYDLMSQSS